jgi:hypothetical protein
MQKIDLKILKDSHVSSILIYENPVFEMQCVCVCVRTSLLVIPERFDRLHSYLVFMSLSIIGWCTVNMDILALKIWALLMGLNK